MKCGYSTDHSTDIKVLTLLPCVLQFIMLYMVLLLQSRKAIVHNFPGVIIISPNKIHTKRKHFQSR